MTNDIIDKSNMKSQVASAKLVNVFEKTIFRGVKVKFFTGTSI